MEVEYWDGVPPEGRGIRDISEGGAYIYTTEKWYTGAIIRLHFHNRKVTPAVSVVVRAQVVRQGKDGFAMEFLFHSLREREQMRKFLASVPSLVKKAPESSPAASSPATSPAVPAPQPAASEPPPHSGTSPQQPRAAPPTPGA
jgi:hypothetical protein